MKRGDIVVRRVVYYNTLALKGPFLAVNAAGYNFNGAIKTAMDGGKGGERSRGNGNWFFSVSGRAGFRMYGTVVIGEGSLEYPCDFFSEFISF